jgi:hypothetical protein
MPLPAESERAGRTIAAELARFDRALLDHIETGDTLPTVAAVMAPKRHEPGTWSPLTSWNELHGS